MMYIPKDKDGDPVPDRLCVIKQYDGKWRILPRLLISHRMVKNRMKRKTRSDQQWGGKEGHQNINLALQDGTIQVIWSLEMRNGVICDFDAVSCFDCIPTNLRILVYKKAGVPSRVTSLFRKALIQGRYRPTTVYGPSPKLNRYTMDSPICRSRQGTLDGTSG